MQQPYESLVGLKILHDISTLVMSGTEDREVYPLVLEKIVDAIQCRSASLFILNEESGKLEEAATVGVKVELVETMDFEMGQGFSAWVAKQRRAVLIPAIRKDRPDGFRSFISVPLLRGENLIGVLNAGHDEQDAFTDGHMNFLEIAASHLAYSIERTRYEARLLEINTRLLEAHEEIRRQHDQIVEMEKFRVLGQMAASINHEINNPLTTILGNVDLLLISQPDMDPLVRKKLGVILSEAKRIAEITKKVRSIKKIVLGDYVERSGEKMIDLDSSAGNTPQPGAGDTPPPSYHGFLKGEILSPPEELSPPDR
jgi:GAF domain-containing protein